MSAEDAPARFWAKVIKTETCWLWTGGHGKYGHGVFIPKTRNEPIMGAHRWSWESVNGPIPPGLVLDHLCRVPACVRPDHLEPVTQAENVRRAPHLGGAQNRRKTHCPKGHPYSGDNLLRWGDMSRRRCRQCEWERRHRAA